MPGRRTARKVTLSEYLGSVYQPDCKYIDGEVRERNRGEFDPADWQLKVGAYFRAKRAKAFLIARPEKSPGRLHPPGKDSPTA